MNIVNLYLSFKGNCEEAFNFYKSVFGGEFNYVGRFKDMPPVDGRTAPAAAAEKLMHISLPISRETALMGSDVIEGFSPPVAFGDNFSVSIATDSKADADRFFNELSQGGRVNMPMANTFWGVYFGMCTDRFGVNWMVSYVENMAANLDAQTDAMKA